MCIYIYICTCIEREREVCGLLDGLDVAGEADGRAHHAVDLEPLRASINNKNTTTDNNNNEYTE